MYFPATLESQIAIHKANYTKNDNITK